MDRSALIVNYWREMRLSSSSERADRLSVERERLAIEAVDQALADPADDAVALLVAIADAAPDRASLNLLGAGPVEDLIHEHGRLLVDEIDEAARRSDRFRIALQHVWYDDSVPPEIVARLQRFGSSS